eukprot:g15629.t1
MKKRVRVDNITPQNADLPEQEYMEPYEYSHPLKRIGAKVHLSKFLDSQKQNGSSSDDDGGAGEKSDSGKNLFFSSSDGSSSGDDGDAKNTEAPVTAREAKRAAARESSAQAVKAGAALIGNVVGLLTYVGLAAKEKLRVVEFQPRDEAERHEFDQRQLYERHFHAFYRTLLAETPWTFAQKHVGEDDAENVIEVLDPGGEIENGLADALEDLKGNKPEQLFSCGWKRFCAAYEDANSDDRASLLSSLTRDAKDLDGMWEKPPPRRRLEEGRARDGFLKWLTAHDSRASVVAYAHNAAVLRSVEEAAGQQLDQQRLLSNHLFFTNRARHVSGMFAGAEKVLQRRGNEIRKHESAILDFPERSGARYQFQHETKTRNEAEYLFLRKTAGERQELDADCRRRHKANYFKVATPAVRALNELTNGGEPGDVALARRQLARKQSLRDKTTCRRTSEVPAAFGRAAEAGILRAAVAVGDSYLKDRADDKGQVVNPQSAGTAAAADADDAAELEAAKELAARFEDLLSAAVKEAVALAKANLKAARLCERLAPLRDRSKTLVVEVRPQKSAARKSNSKSSVLEVDVQHWAVHWDIARPDRASLVRLHQVRPIDDSFVRLGGWGEEPEIVQLDGPTVSTRTPDERGGGSSATLFATKHKTHQARGGAVGVAGSGNLRSSLCGAKSSAGGGANGGKEVTPTTEAAAMCRAKPKESAAAGGGLLSCSKAGSRADDNESGSGPGSSSSSRTKTNASGPFGFGGDSLHPGQKQQAAQGVTISASILKTRLADAEWVDVQTFTSVLFPDPGHFAFYLASTMVVFPLARNQAEVEAGLEFSTNLPKNEDSKGFYDMIEQQERDLSRFYPKVDGYLPASDCDPGFPVISNDPWLLYTKETKVQPITGLGNILKASRGGGPRDPSEREKKPAEQHEAASNLFVYNANVRRSWKVTNRHHVQNLGLYGLSRAAAPENGANDIAVDAQELGRPFLEEEEDNEIEYNVVPAPGHDQNVTTEEIKKIARKSFSSADGQQDDNDEQLLLLRVAEQELLQQEKPLLQPDAEREHKLGQAGMPGHPFWPVETFTWVSRDQTVERFRSEGEVASSYQCKPVPWSTEGKRYNLIWERFSNVAKDLFKAQASTRGATRSFQPGRGIHARY